LAAAENMLCGRAVVVSNLGSLSEVVGDAGLVVTAGEAEELARCLERFWEEPSLFGQLGSRARERAIHFFGGQRMLDDHARLYRALTRD
jgi:glycosyltransferase involved in cell wall biosynthesis